MRWTIFPSRSAGSRLYARSFTLFKAFPNKSEILERGWIDGWTAMLRFSGTKNLGEKIMQYLRKCPLRDKKKEMKNKKKIGRNGMKRGSEGVEMVSAVRRSWIANSRGKVAVVYATGDGH